VAPCSIQRVLKMKQRPRIYYNETHKAMMSDRSRRGELLHDIARLFDRHHTSARRAGEIDPAHSAATKPAKQQVGSYPLRIARLQRSQLVTPTHCHTSCQLAPNRRNYTYHRSARRSGPG